MVAEEDPEITSCHRHKKSTATYRKNSENQLNDYSTKEGKRPHQDREKRHRHRFTKTPPLAQ